MNEVGGVYDHTVPFGNRFFHQPKFSIFQITDPAMRHVRGSGRCARTKIAPIDEQDIDAV